MTSRALLTLTVLPDRYAICRLAPTERIPEWATGDDFVSISRSRDELSIVCPERNVPSDINAAKGWRVLRCEGPLDYTLSGIMASLAEPLADASVPIFPVATHDTDYVLIKEPQLDVAVHALTSYGHAVRV
jgi:uncharacterized protein